MDMRVQLRVQQGIIVSIPSSLDCSGMVEDGVIGILYTGLYKTYIKIDIRDQSQRQEEMRVGRNERCYSS